MGSGGEDIVGARKRVEAGEEAGHPAAEALHVADGEQPLRGGGLLAGMKQRPVQRLDLVFARLAAEVPYPVAHDPRRGGAEHRAHGRADLGT